MACIAMSGQAKSRKNGQYRLAGVAVTTLALLGMTACAGDDVGSQSDNVTDSFYNPTEHGELEFTAPNPAELTDEQRFHSWTFSLSGEAEIELGTELYTQNLGSVMYLYRRRDNGNWGSYIDKSQDYEDGPASFIAKSLDAGEYRIKVKAVKTYQTGSLAVVASCDGAGCPEPGGGMCVGEGPMQVPSGGHYGPSCNPILEALATTPAAPAPAGCADALEARAVAYYKAYWDGIYGYEEVSSGEEPSVDTIYKPGAGSVVRVDLGGDEDAMDYVFDPDGNLVLYYQHNQSPDWAWFCPGATEADAAQEPDESCFMQVLYNQDYDAADVTEGSGTATAGDTGELPKAVGAALDAYGAETGTILDYDFRLWDAAYNDGAEVTVSAEGNAPATFVVTGDGEWALTVVMKSTSEGTSFVCQQL